MSVAPYADRRGVLIARLPQWRSPTGRRVMRALVPLGRLVRVLLPFAVLVGIWQLATTVTDVPSFSFPRPVDVADAFYDLARKGLLLDYTVDSVVRWLVGAVTGVAVGVLVALILAFSRPLRALLMPLVRFLTAVAELAWLPLVILWFQFGFTTIVVIIWYTVIFPVLYNVLNGIESVPKVTCDAVRTLGSTRWQLVREVLLPGALPSLVAGFRIGAGYAFRALVAIEILATNTGLGYLIFESRQSANTDRTVVGMIMLGLLWLVIDRMYLRPIERATVDRWGFASE